MKFFKWLKSIFVKEQNSHGYGKPEALKWGVIVPHTQKAPGAVTKGGVVSEYNYAGFMAQKMKFSYFYRDGIGVLGAAKKLAQYGGCNASLEPHLNAFNNRARGFEILVMEGDRLSYDIAENIATAFKEAYPDRILRHGNGVKVVKKGDAGFYNLRDAKRGGMKVALLSEAFFIDNPDEWIDQIDMAKFWESVLK